MLSRAICSARVAFSLIASSPIALVDKLCHGMPLGEAECHNHCDLPNLRLHIQLTRGCLDERHITFMSNKSIEIRFGYIWCVVESTCSLRIEANVMHVGTHDQSPLDITYTHKSNG